MTYMRLVTLLLALWAPFNAVTAGVVMLDCPMNEATATPAEPPCPSHATTDTGDHGTTACDHCASCVLHGGVSIPTSFSAAILPLPQAVPDTRVADQAAPGVPSTPFRPPLSA